MKRLLIRCLGFIKNKQGLTTIGKGVVTLLVLALLSYPSYKAYDKIKLNKLIKESINGEAYAQIKLGVRYVNGNGLEQNDYKAFNLFEKAANQGVAKAQFNIGRMYYQGKGTSKNNDRALYWIRKAAEQESKDAQFILGAWYFQGEVVDKDFEKGSFYINRAIKNGSIQAKEYDARMKKIATTLNEISENLNED